jgi:hypothetical protein
MTNFHHSGALEELMPKKLISCFVIVIALSILSFAGEIQYPATVDSALVKADSNKAELEKVIAHYRESGDTLKLQAAYYLIGNMDGHSYMVFGLYDSAKVEYPFDVMAYPNLDSLQISFDSLASAHPSLDFGKKQLTEDLRVITADFLIKHIDEAFMAWRDLPWAKSLSYTDFCEYVLPYRGSNEPLEDWRQYFLDKYADLPSKMKDPSDRIEATKLINIDIKSYFTFDSRYYYHPTDQGLSEMLKNHLGRCEDMTNLAIYAMRANGLAVTSDYTPYWANSGNNHAWNSILLADGRVVPFMGAEAEPGEYHLWNKLAKVYRKMYSQQPQNLIFQPRKQKKVPAWLAGKSYIDVTSDYVATSDVTINLTEKAPDSVDIAYLCVFNDGAWRPIHWGRIDGKKVTFNAMGRDIAYLPVYFVKEDSITPAGNPFILTATGEINEFPMGACDTKAPVSLLSTTARADAPSTDGIAKSSLEKGKTYELFYWEDAWVSAGTAEATAEPLKFEAPPNTIYWLVQKDSNHDERIFTYDDGKQIWW